MSEQNASPSADENHLIAERREKLRTWRESGRAYPNDFSRENTAGKLDEAYGEKTREELEATPVEVRVAGRVMLKRVMGKASFATIQDLSGRIQLYVSNQGVGEDVHGDFKHWDIGDIVGAVGTLFKTKTGELTVNCTEIRLLSKNLRPLPEKFHGLTDQETKYRQRYLDLIMNEQSRFTFVARSRMVQSIRNYMMNHGFLEVETPMMHPIPGGASAKPFTTHHNALDMELFLRIAPELYLKRLLVGGYERVYEIGRCYRNEGISTRHNPEFTMLEYYQAYATYQTLMDNTERMLRHVDGYLERRLTKRGHGEVFARWKAERAFTLDEPFVRIPMREAIDRGLSTAQLSADVMAELSSIALPDPEAADAAALRAAGDQKVAGYREASERARAVDWHNLRRALSVCETEGDRVFVAYEYLVEPFLTADYKNAAGDKSLPVFIIDYPFEVSPLARKKDADPMLTDRFELFVDGRELCNAFSELNDPDDQAARFRDQVERKSRGAEETMDYDEDYIRALEHGMPPAAGFGLGVDRLVMMLAGQASIRDVIAFPLLRPEALGSE